MTANILSLLLYMRATTITGMAIARALQGVSSSAILVVGTALIKDSVSEERTGMGMAFTTAAIQMGLIIGPAFGGLMYVPDFLSRLCGSSTTSLPLATNIG